METTTPLFRQSLESQLVAKALADKNHDPRFTYAELSKIAGIPDITLRRGVIVTARRAARREHRIVFAAVRGVGLKRLTDSEIVASRSQARTTIRNVAKNSKKSLECVVHERLTRDEQTRFAVEDAALGIVAACMSTKGQGAIEQKVIENKNCRLEIGDLRSAFK